MNEMMDQLERCINGIQENSTEYDVIMLFNAKDFITVMSKIYLSIFKKSSAQLKNPVMFL